MARKGEILERNEFLDGFEKLLKKYGYTEVYGEYGFCGEKTPGISYVIKGVEKPGAVSEIWSYVDPTKEMEDYIPEDLPYFFIKDDAFGLGQDCLIYDGTNFYRR